jgi:hypothetical protein
VPKLADVAVKDFAAPRVKAETFVRAKQLLNAEVRLAAFEKSNAGTSRKLMQFEHSWPR